MGLEARSLGSKHQQCWILLKTVEENCSGPLSWALTFSLSWAHRWHPSCGFTLSTLCQHLCVRVYLCVQIYPFSEDTSYTGFKLTLMISP